MARAWIVEKVSGKTDRYVVQDDLGVQYEVLSAVAGYDYEIGKDYRLFAPNGKYEPCKFRLLPYKTSKRWREVGKLGETYPATASALYFYREKIAAEQAHDENKTVSEVHDGHLHFVEGGCARVPTGDEDSYQSDDCVAVINDTLTDDGVCMKADDGDPWVAGFGCDQEPETTACSNLFEYWSNYMEPSADLINGGGNADPELNAPGVFIFNKSAQSKGEIKKWTAKVSDLYVGKSQPYGAPASVWAGDRLKMESVKIDRVLDYAEGAGLAATYPRPIVMPANPGPYDPTARVVLSPPVIMKTYVGRKLYCRNNQLKMTVNLLTRDEKNHYVDMDGYGTGLQLPACMILIFSKAPYPDYLDGSTINPNLYTTDPPASLPKYASVKECNLDERFTLVYTAPGMQSFASLRVDHPASAASGQYALIRPVPRRGEDGSYAPINGAIDLLRYKYNAPMDDPENGFSNIPLYTRCFDYNGADITPVPVVYPTGGFFPGFFEIADQSNVTRNVYQDFMAAYPFMNNPDINPDGKIPTLSTALFYVQGKVFLDAQNEWGANMTALECQRLEFFYS